MTEVVDLHGLITHIEELSAVNPALQLKVPNAFSSPEEEIKFVSSHNEEIKMELQNAMNSMNAKLELLEKADLAMDIISYKLFETEHDFRQKVEELNKLQEQILATEQSQAVIDTDNSHLGMEMINIETQIQDVQNDHIQQVEGLKVQKWDMQQKYEDAVSFLDELFEDFKKLVEVYANYIRSSTPEEHIELIADQLEVYNNFKNYMEQLQKTGWKMETEEMKLNTRMESLGIKVTKSFNFYTQSGQMLTIEDIKNQGLLDNISISWERLLKNTTDSPLEPVKPVEETIIEQKEDKPLPTEQTRAAQPASSKLSFDSPICRLRTDDVAYLKEKLGKPLTLALAEITALRPRDPIHYLGHWLFKYRYNQEMYEVERAELNALNAERQRIARERWHQFLEQEARAVLMDLIIRADEEALRRELERIERDMMLMQGEEEHQEDEEALNEEARDKFENY